MSNFWYRYDLYSLLLFLLGGILWRFPTLLYRLYGIWKDTSDISHALDTFLSEYHHGAWLHDLWDVKTESHEALLSRTQWMAKDFLHHQLTFTQRLISFCWLGYTFLIDTDGRCWLLNASTVHSRPILFLDGCGMMKHDDLSFELVSAQLLQEVFLSYRPLVFVHILGEVSFQSEEKNPVLEVTPLQLSGWAISVCYQDCNVLPAVSAWYWGSVLFNIIYNDGLELLMTIWAHQQLLVNIYATLDNGPADH